MFIFSANFFSTGQHFLAIIPYHPNLTLMKYKKVTRSVLQNDVQNICSLLCEIVNSICNYLKNHIPQIKLSFIGSTVIHYKIDL